MDHTSQDLGHENTQGPQNYATGCHCAQCRTQGRTPTQPGETCTATRWTDNH